MHASASPASFLSLPEGLRYKIYKDAELITGDVLRIVQHNNTVQEKNDWRFIYNEAVLNISGSFDAPPYAVTGIGEPVDPGLEAYFNLSLTSWRVRADVAQYLCAQNSILLCCERYTDLSLLYGMRPHLIRALTHLTFHLDVASHHNMRCRTWSSCCHHEWLGQAHIKNNYKHLKLTSENFNFFIARWSNVLDYVASHAVKSRLQLRIYANVDDVSVAEQILQPIERNGFAVRQLRLSREQNPALKNIASRGVDTTAQIDSRPFCFLDLPPELRQHVLSFTSVLTPDLKIFVRGKRFVIFRESNDGSLQCPSEEFCSIAHDVQPIWKHYDTPVWPPCDCWMPPSPIFLVCKEMLDDARALFFSANHFVVESGHRTGDQYRHFEASFFIGHLVPMDALSHLRSLELHFPARVHDFFGPSTPSGIDKLIYADWRATIEYMALWIRKLKLRFHMGVPDRASPTSPLTHLETALERQFHTNVHIVRPLQRLPCIDRFEILVHWPFVGRHQSDLQEKLADHEMHLKSLVTGERGGEMVTGTADL